AFWPGEEAPCVTLHALITQDPKTGTRNVGMCPMQKIDRCSTYMHWQIHKDGPMVYLATDGRLDVAVAIGLDPVTAYSASAPLPKHVDELMLAGFLRGDAVELVQAKTVDLDVPAAAEIVLEGYVEAGGEGAEGPFRDPTGYYTAPQPLSRFPNTARTTRRHAAGRGRLARQGDRADLPPGGADVRARDRRLRLARRRGIPQLRDRVDPEDIPRAGTEDHARGLGTRPAEPDQVRRRRRRVGERP